MDGKYVCGAEIKKILGVADSTLREWADTGKIKSFRTPGGQRRYEVSDLFKRPHTINTVAVVEKPKKGIVYARVSSGKQRDDLDRQIAFLRIKYISRPYRHHRRCQWQHVLSIHNVRITVLDVTEMSPEQELSDDLFSIVQIFCCRRNGKRRYTIKAGDADAENQNQPHESPETDAE